MPATFLAELRAFASPKDIMSARSLHGHLIGLRCLEGDFVSTDSGYRLSAILPGQVQVTQTGINLVMGTGPFREFPKTDWLVVAFGEVPPQALVAYARKHKFPMAPASKLVEFSQPGAKTELITLLAYQLDAENWNSEHVLAVCHALGIELVVFANQDTLRFYNRKPAMFNLSSWLPSWTRGQLPD